MKIAVLGAGVCGLTAAIRLQEDGHELSIYAEEVTPTTTSDVAPAVFFPYSVPATTNIIAAAKDTLTHYTRLYNGATRGAAGLRCQHHYEASSNKEYAEAHIEPFGKIFGDFEQINRAATPGGYEFCWRMTTFFIDTRRYMSFLMGNLRSEIEIRSFNTLDDVLCLPHDTIVNCLGLGSRTVFGDTAVAPVKGQILYVRPTGDVKYSIIHDTFYLFPRWDDWVLGGTTEKGVYDLTVSEETTAAIVEGNKRLVPSLSRQDVLGARTGLRPYREPEPRLDVEAIGKKRVVHNYGHGGGGLTVAWGCAERVARMVNK